MTEGRRREAWDHTASLMALIANCNRDAQKVRRPFHPDQFHPMRQGGERRESSDDKLGGKQAWEMLKKALGSGQILAPPGSG